MFILCLEIYFTTFKNNKDVKSLNNFGDTFLYTAYADDKTFFLKKMGSIKKLLDTISLFSSFSSLKTNLSKCKVPGIGLLEGVKLPVYGIKCINLTKDAIKILGILFSHNKNIELEQNFKKIIIGIEKVLRMGQRRNLTLQGKIIIFKTLALSKFVFLGHVLLIPNEITTTIKRIQEEFLWNPNNLISMHFINNTFEKNFINYSDLSFNTSILHQFPTFYAKILRSPKKYFLISLTFLDA